jgi:hypothetical protein
MISLPIFKAKREKLRKNSFPTKSWASQQPGPVRFSLLSLLHCNPPLFVMTCTQIPVEISRNSSQYLFS